MKKLREEGLSYAKIAKQFKLTPNAVLYHLNSEFRNSLREYNRKRYGEMTKKQKKKVLEKKREYMRNYHRRRYNGDKEFRDKQIERSKEYQRGKNNG